MKDVLRSLLTDFLTTLLFLAVYVATGSPPIGAATAIAAGTAQVAFQIRTGRHIALMQWVNFGLIVGLAGFSIATRDPRFVMMKPSIIHFAVAAAMLQPGWANRYLTDTARRHLPPAVPVAAGYAWAGLMIALGTANILFALYADFATWAWFVSVVALGAKVAAFLLQYAVFRTLIKRSSPIAAAVPAAGVP